MAMKTSRKPPYISDVVWDQFFDQLKRINPPDSLSLHDLRKMGLAPKQEAALSSALVFLGLTESNGAATGKLKTLVGTDEALAKSLRAILEDAYSDLISKYQVDKANLDDLKNYFALNHSNASASKMVRSFLGLAKRANWMLNAHSEIKQKHGKAAAPRVNGPSGKRKQLIIKRRPANQGKEAVASTELAPPHSVDTDLINIPIALGPGRTWSAYIERDASHEDMKRFILMLSIALGVDD